MTPKCTSWRGHKFEGRYSEYRELAYEVEAITVELIDAMRRKVIYERDICIRCGITVEKKP